MKIIKTISLLVIIGMSMPLTAGCGASNMTQEVHPIIHVNVQPVNLALAQSNANGVDGQEQNDEDSAVSEQSEVENKEVAALNELRGKCNKYIEELIMVEQAIKEAETVEQFNENCEEYVKKAQAFNEFAMKYSHPDYPEKAKKVLKYSLLKVKLKHMYLMQELAKIRKPFIEQFFVQQLTNDQLLARLASHNAIVAQFESLSFDLRSRPHLADEVIEQRERKRDVAQGANGLPCAAQESARVDMSQLRREESVAASSGRNSISAASRRLSRSRAGSDKIRANVAKVAATKRRNSE